MRTLRLACTAACVMSLTLACRGRDESPRPDPAASATPRTSAVGVAAAPDSAPDAADASDKARLAEAERKKKAAALAKELDALDMKMLSVLGASSSKPLTKGDVPTSMLDVAAGSGGIKDAGGGGSLKPGQGGGIAGIGDPGAKLAKPSASAPSTTP